MTLFLPCQAAETLELVKELVEQRDAAQAEAQSLSKDEEALDEEEEQIEQVLEEDEQSLQEQDAVIQGALMTWSNHCCCCVCSTVAHLRL